jgi:acetyl-CoA carboxylase biotin carboxyl carrier protein
VAAPPARPEADGPTKTLHLIKSPTPGTFYARPKPDAEPYVRVGTRVTPTTVVCQIEAMKIFNEIQAECAGVITEVLVENQQPVEYDQPLFKVDVTA